MPVPDVGKLADDARKQSRKLDKLAGRVRRLAPQTGSTVRIVRKPADVGCKPVHCVRNLANVADKLADEVCKSSTKAEKAENPSFLPVTTLNRLFYRPDGAGEWGGADGYKDFAPNGAGRARHSVRAGVANPRALVAIGGGQRTARPTNRDAVAAFSPALTDAVGLRWVNGQKENNSEGVEAGGTAQDTKYANGIWIFHFAYFAWFAVEFGAAER